MDQDGFVAEFKKRSDTLDIIGKSASIDVGNGATDAAGRDTEFAVAQKAVVGAVNVVERLVVDDDAKGVDSRSADRLNFAGVKISLEIAATRGVASDIDIPGFGIFEAKAAVINGADESFIRIFFALDKFVFEFGSVFIDGSSDGGVDLAINVNADRIPLEILPDKQANKSHSDQADDDEDDGFDDAAIMIIMSLGQARR